MSRIENVKKVVAVVLMEHPDYRLLLGDEGWSVYCTGPGCEWSKRLRLPLGEKGARRHVKHVAYKVATAAGLSKPEAAL